MTTDKSCGDWDWEDPDEFARMKTHVDNAEARTRHLRLMPPRPPFTRQHLNALGLTGIEFGTVRTNHVSGLSADITRLTSDDSHTDPNRLYRVNRKRYFAEIDIRQPLPFSDSCVDWVYAEHVIEHVKLAEAIAWLAETRRILSPGGLLRLTTPDLARYADAYVRRNGFFDEHRRRMGSTMPARPAFMMNQIFYLYGHRWIYDEAELRHALAAAEYDLAQVRLRRYREGLRADVASLDKAVRNDETMYVEATV